MNSILNLFIRKWDSLYYKPGQVLQSELTLLQSGAGIAKGGNHYHKVGQFCVITKWGKSYHKKGQVIY